VRAGRDNGSKKGNLNRVLFWCYNAGNPKFNGGILCGGRAVFIKIRYFRGDKIAKNSFHTSEQPGNLPNGFD